MVFIDSEKMTMTPIRCAAIALVVATTAWSANAATDYFWNCTTADGIKYADATRCDNGDVAVKVMKGSRAVPSAQTPMVQKILGNDTAVHTNTGVCPSNPNVCEQPNYGVSDGSPRDQAITQFMRKKECDFMQRYPQRCTKPRN